MWRLTSSIAPNRSFTLSRFSGWSIEGASYTSGLGGGLQVTLRKGQVEARVTIDDRLRVWPHEVRMTANCPAEDLIPFLCGDCPQLRIQAR
jgi:hypothetical protein